VLDVATRVGVAPHAGDRATIAALRGAARARVLHVAAHGGLNAGGAYLSLADGEVTSTDIVTWRLAPRLVVLASCASGARPSGSMWGALGGAFLAAGSEAVIATLWSVEDQATAALVRAFYAAGGAEDPVRALAVAQREAITAGASPRQWSSFVVLATPAERGK
jgi:CHAT domain-containing protein